MLHRGAGEGGVRGVARGDGSGVGRGLLKPAKRRLSVEAVVWGFSVTVTGRCGGGRWNRIDADFEPVLVPESLPYFLLLNDRG